MNTQVKKLLNLLSSPTYQAYCALFDKSTKIGTHVDYHLINILG